MQKSNLESWATHLPVLESILNNCPIESVFEFGSGFGSTPLFIERCKHVHSIEMQNDDWFHRVNEKFKECSGFTYEKAIGPRIGIDIFKNTGRNYDLVFVDGHGDTRWDCINKSFDRTNIIVTHDTNVPSYKWNLIEIPTGWEVYEYKKIIPYTKIFYTNATEIHSVIQELEV